MTESSWTRKQRGAYYTPDEVAHPLAEWAIRNPAERVLDPSFGGCAFLEAAAERLSTLGAERPFENLYGFDTDRQSLKSLARLLAGDVPSDRFKVPHDFLASAPGSSESPLVDVVVGNPPYVRHHLLKGARREIAREAATSGGYELSARSSYWAYFVLHAVRFLEPDGRLAFVLPISLLAADYADPVRAVLFRGFGRTRVIVVDQRLFDDAEERSVVVLADGWTKPNDGVSIERVGNALGLSAAVAEEPSQWNGRGLLSDKSAWRRELVAADALRLIDALRSGHSVRALGDIAEISLGAVTGANGFFVLPSHKMHQIGALRRQRLPTLSGSRDVGGLVANRETFKELRTKRGPCELLFLREGDGATGVRGYLHTKAAKQAKLAYKCEIRKPWFALGDRARPDAFLTPLSGSYPRLILNDWKFDCTNTLYRVTWRNQLTETRAKLAAISVVSTLGSLSAELAGRVYSGGALKLEPRDARKILVLDCALPNREVGSHFRRIDCLLAADAWSEAQAQADEFVLSQILRLDRPRVRRIQGAMLALRSLRQAK
jgi:hypothetical protein